MKKYIEFYEKTFKWFLWVLILSITLFLFFPAVINSWTYKIIAVFYANAPIGSIINTILMYTTDIFDLEIIFSYQYTIFNIVMPLIYFPVFGCCLTVFIHSLRKGKKDILLLISLSVLFLYNFIYAVINGKPFIPFYLSLVFLIFQVLYLAFKKILLMPKKEKAPKVAKLSVDERIKKLEKELEELKNNKEA